MARTSLPPSPSPRFRNPALPRDTALSPVGPRSGGDGEEALVEKALRILRNRKWVILQALIIIPAIVLIVSLSQDKKYTASASLLFQQGASGSGPVDPSRQAVTNEELLDLPVVAQRTARLLDGRANTQGVESSVDFESTTDSDLVSITATTTSARLSADMANRYGEAYVAFRSEADQADLQRRFDIYETSYRALSPEDRAGTRGQRLLERLDRLKLSQALREGEATRTADVVQRATVPTEASSPNVPRNLALAIVFALAIGIALASLLERLNRAVNSIDEFESIYGMPVLARVPRMKSTSRRRPAGDNRATQEAEAFRLLRANLRYFNVDPDRELKSILVASPMSGDGKSTVALGLAMTMASMGDRVVLVEADMHKTYSSDAFRQPSDLGLSTVLAGQVSLDDALTEVPLSSAYESGNGRMLSVLRSGPIPPNPSELMEGNRMRSVILELEERFGTVIIDSPPSQVSDALTLVPETSGVIVVSRLRHTTRDAALQTKNQLELLDAHTLGLVANFSAKTGSYYYGE